MPALDPVALAQALVRAPSVTPADAGAMAVVEAALLPLGFNLRRMRFGGVENLYARRGEGGRRLMFAGHVDVVPPGDHAAWSAPPFAAEVRGGWLIGRGAADMKGAIAAWIAAISRTPPPARGVQSLLITGDEEGAALEGTRRVVETLIGEGERVDHCLVGEPTSVAQLGDMMKTGRRGSLNATVTVVGVQGHVAYPERAANPIPVLLTLLQRLQAEPLDAGWSGFQPSNMEVTNLHVGNSADNVIPAVASARFNVRFNPAYQGVDLLARLETARAQAEHGFAGSVRLEARVSGEAFATPPGPFTELVASAVQAATGRTPERSTSGGTSDARFIRALCPVIEFGLVGATMHKVDEHAPVADLLALSDIYAELNRRYFA